MTMYEKIAEELRRRIEDGYYVLRHIPSIRKLADEFKVSDFTIRKAIKNLRQQGFWDVSKVNSSKISPNKKNATNSAINLRLAYLFPQWSSFATSEWQATIFRAARNFGATVRMVPYYNWVDPLVLDAVNSFDGSFIQAPAEDIPPAISEKIRSSSKPAVVLQYDCSSLGIPCIRTIHPSAPSRMLDHLASQGFIKISCLNAQPHDLVIQDYIQQFLLWDTIHGKTGELIDQSPKPYTNPLNLAYETMTNYLYKRKWDNDSALLATTMPAALGAMRAFINNKIIPGKDVAICTIDGEGISEFLTPPLTSIESEDPYKFIELSLNWMQSKNSWIGPMLMQPVDAKVIARKSTVFNL